MKEQKHILEDFELSLIPQSANRGLARRLTLPPRFASSAKRRSAATTTRVGSRAPCSSRSTPQR